MFEPSTSDGSITQHPSAPKKNTQCFTEETQLGQINSTTVNSKLSTLIRYVYGYKTYSHAVFAGFLPGFISVHGCFYFVARDKIFSPKHIYLVILTMATEEHSYALADSTTVSIRLLCGPDFEDFTDAVPFHVTDMYKGSPTDSGKLYFKLSVVTHCNTARTSLIMANFLDADSEREYIDISSTEADTDPGAMPDAGAQGMAHNPPQWPTRTVSSENTPLLPACSLRGFQRQLSSWMLDCYRFRLAPR